MSPRRFHANVFGAAPPAPTRKATGIYRRPWPVLVLSALLLCTVACQPDNVELDSSELEACSPVQLAEWNDTVDNTLGINGRDPVGADIASFPAERFGSVINNWYPLHPIKQTLCGTLHHFNVYDGTGDEMDWNNFIIPTGEFAFLIEDALPFKGGSGTWCQDDNWHDCSGTDNCMEGEITPDQTFYENPWFPKSVGASLLEGQTICTYGPWVRECVHGHRPEIHPTEILWWKEALGNNTLFWIMVQQDDSNRFDSEDDFDIEGSKPPGWRPWGTAPLREEVRVAFEVDPSGPVVDVIVGESFARNVVTKFDLDVSVDADNGTEHAIELDGEVILKATELQPNDNDLGVLFTDLCRRPNGRLQGYVSINTRVGADNSGGEGYHILFVTLSGAEDDPGPITPPGIDPGLVLTAEALPDSVRPGSSAGAPELLGDLRIEIAGPTPGSHEEPVVEGVVQWRDDESRELQYSTAQDGRGVVLSGVSLIGPSRIEVALRSAKPLAVEWPGLSAAALVEASVADTTEASAGAWGGLVAAAGGTAVPAVPGGFDRAGRITLRALPLFAAERDGQISIEEGSPIVQRLNEALAEGGSTAQRVFGTEHPVGLDWSFEATNRTDGKTVQVVVGEAVPGSGAVHVVLSGGPRNDTAEVTFPAGDADALFELSATVRSKGAFGSSHEGRVRVWSHALTTTGSSDEVTRLLEGVAEMAGLAKDGLRLAAASTSTTEIRDPELRRKRMLRTFAEQADADGRIDLDELEGLVRLASLLGR